MNGLTTTPGSTRGNVSTNLAEGYFSQLKRSIDGTHHHVSTEHLQRYLTQFDFLYSHCRDTDSPACAACSATSKDGASPTSHWQQLRVSPVSSVGVVTLEVRGRPSAPGNSGTR